MLVSPSCVRCENGGATSETLFMRPWGKDCCGLGGADGLAIMDAFWRTYGM